MSLIPPHDEAAERFCLGYGMLFGVATMPELQSRHFFFDRNQMVFAALEDGAEGPHGVAQLLKASTGPGASVYWGNLLKVGGGTYLGELVLDVESGKQGREALDLHAACCAESVREMWKRRVVIAAARQVTEELCGRLSSAEAWSKFREACKNAAIG